MDHQINNFLYIKEPAENNFLLSSRLLIIHHISNLNFKATKLVRVLHDILNFSPFFHLTFPEKRNTWFFLPESPFIL